MVGKTLAMPEPKHGHLVIISRSGGDGKAFPMHNSRVLIGRKETCDIRMQRPEVSKEHCVIRIADGAVVLKNLSENGTSVNDHALAAGQQHTLKTGDVITIVGRSLRYEQPRPGSSTLQTPPQPLRRLASLHRPQSEVISRPHIRREPISNALFTGRRMPRDPEVARKFRAWDAHYADDDDPFSASAESAASTSAFQRMAASVQRFNSAGATCSPLKRTVSNGGPLLHTPTDTGGDSSDEVPTEPEPESESEQEPDPVRAQPVQHVQRTPSIRRILMTDMSSAARKSVRFGPPLSPEVFDTQAPPSTPLRRGTPMQMARVSSILRQSSERLLSAESALPVPASNDNSKVETDEEDEEKEKIHEPIKEIESPVALGSPEDRRNRRRRSLRAVRRATLEPRALETSPSPSLVVRTRAAANDLTPSRLFQADASTAQSRTERRRTAPESLSATLAEMAAALGEDVPAAFKKPEVPLPEPEREHEEEADEEKEEEKKEH
ncbi:antigen identified by monoclonal antibody Ki-67, partial [Coemansia sp. RSA 2618]